MCMSSLRCCSEPLLKVAAAIHTGKIGGNTQDHCKNPHFLIRKSTSGDVVILFVSVKAQIDHCYLQKRASCKSTLLQMFRMCTVLFMLGLEKELSAM